MEDEKVVRSFKEVGVCEQLVEACNNLGWYTPSTIQALVLPHAFQVKDLDLIGVASGKTGAFAIPILQSLVQNPQPLYACVLSPTRELAIQIALQFQALGSATGVKCTVLVGGVDQAQQRISLAKQPHIIVATPGRLVDHLSNTKGFSLRTVKYLVLDEADRLLNDDFEKVFDDILSAIPWERKTYLYSATMTKKVQKLQRACLRNPVKIEAASKYSTVDTLKQQYRLVPAKCKKETPPPPSRNAYFYLYVQRHERLSRLNVTKLSEVPVFELVCDFGRSDPRNYISSVICFDAGSEIFMVGDVFVRQGQRRESCKPFFNIFSVDTAKSPSFLPCPPTIASGLAGPKVDPLVVTLQGKTYVLALQLYAGEPCFEVFDNGKWETLPPPPFFPFSEDENEDGLHLFNAGRYFCAVYAWDHKIVVCLERGILLLL